MLRQGSGESFLTMGSRKLIPPSISENFKEIGDWKEVTSEIFALAGLGGSEGLQLGNFGEIPRKSRKTRQEQDLGKFLPFDCRDDNLEERELHPCLFYRPDFSHANRYRMTWTAEHEGEDRLSGQRLLWWSNTTVEERVLKIWTVFWIFFDCYVLVGSCLINQWFLNSCLLFPRVSHWSVRAASKRTCVMRT